MIPVKVVSSLLQDHWKCSTVDMGFCFDLNFLYVICYRFLIIFSVIFSTNLWPIDQVSKILLILFWIIYKACRSYRRGHMGLQSPLTQQKLQNYIQISSIVFVFVKLSYLIPFNHILLLLLWINFVPSKINPWISPSLVWYYQCNVTNT